MRASEQHAVHVVGPTGEVNVLVVDDDEHRCRSVQHMLSQVEGSKYRFKCVADHACALLALQHEQHDVVLIQHACNDKIGLEFLVDVKRLDMHCSVIVLTTAEDPVIHRQAMTLGAADCFDVSELGPILLDRAIRYARDKSRLLDELNRVAKKDTLTGLANRRHFKEFLEGAISRADRAGDGLGLAFIDLDHFKGINDRYGHDVGDRVLIEVGELLRKSVRRGDLVARLGGDEFAVILDRVSSIASASRVAENILREFEIHATRPEPELPAVRGSIGIAVYPDDADSLEGLVNGADTAMYEAKRAGRGTYQCLRSQMQAKAIRRAEMHSALGSAIANQELTVHYQPQVAVHAGHIVGLEALVRWTPPGGAISPSEFIPIAERNGLIHRIGEWVLRTACGHYQRLCTEGLLTNRSTLAVNISAQQLSRDDLYPLLRSVLDETRMDPGLLELELTETSALSNMECAIAELRRINELGVRIALDDFGTGHSTLNQLKRLPIQTLKIDRSFVRDAVTDVNDAVLVKGTLALASALGLAVVAEGVETEEQANFLLSNRCAIMQGYLFHEPKCFEDLTELLSKAADAPAESRELAARWSSINFV